MKYMFSVLISVYDKEKPEFLLEALKSIFNQTLEPNEVVLIEDGPLNSELRRVIDEFMQKEKKLKVIKLPKNVGLGQALKIGVDHCKYDFIARMDSDDISLPTRFEKQIQSFKKNENISVIGSYISEFYKNKEEIQCVRVVPKEHTEIKKMVKRRNPMNHVSIMFKKSDLKEVGNYKHMLYLEDYYLWVRFIGNNKKLFNIQESLVLVRTGQDMYKRRGNLEYIKSWKLLQNEMIEYNLINIVDKYINMILIFIFIHLHPNIKEKLYKKILRHNKVE